MKLFRGAPSSTFIRSILIGLGTVTVVALSSAGCSNSSQGPQVLPKKFPGAGAPKGASAAKAPPKSTNQ